MRIEMRIAMLFVIGWVGLDYSVSSSPFLRFFMRFEFLSEMFDHLVCESRDPSLTLIFNSSGSPYNS